MKIRDARFVAAATEYEQLPPPTAVEIAFAGRSNVGKSSLINRLVGRRKLARTSNTPGATRSINVYRVELSEPATAFNLVDLPGYGFARRSKKERKQWGELMERFFTERPGLSTAVVLVDARRGPEDDDLDLVAWLKELGKTPLLVATKVDALKASERKLALAAMADQAEMRVWPTSAETGDGIEALWPAALKAANLLPR